MSEMRSLVTRKINAETHKALNILATPRHGIDVTFAGHAWQVQSRMVVRADLDQKQLEAAFTLEATLSGHDISLRVPTRILATLLGATLPAGTPISHIPESLSLALIEMALGELVANLSAVGIGFELRGLTQNDVLPDQEHILSVSLTDMTLDESTANRILVFASDGALPALASLYGRMPADDVLDVPNIPKMLRLEVGESNISLSDLRSLRAGDAIFPDTINVPDSAGGILLRVSKKLGLRGVWHGSQITIQEVITVSLPPSDAPEIVDEDSDIPEIDGETPSGSDPLELSSFADIPVRLTFDLGHHEISLADLQKTGVGSVFETGREAENMVTIRANGAAIGRGEMVNIDDRIGLRITRWNITPDGDKD